MAEQQPKAMDSLQKIAGFLLCLTVEPLGLFIFLAFHIYMTVIQDGLYQIVCYRLHGVNNRCATKDFNELDENEIQIQIAKWAQALMLSFMIPGAISSIILGSWGDMTGRKINLMFAISGMIIGIFPMTYNLTYKSSSLWITVIIQIIGGSMGFLTLIMVSSMAYLSDTIDDKEALSIRMVCFAVLMSVATVIGSLISGILMESFGLPGIIALVEALLTIAFLYALIRLRQVPPMHMLKYMQNKKIYKDNSKLKPAGFKMNEQNDNNLKFDKQKKEIQPEQNCCQTFVIAVTRAFNLIADVIRTYLKRRSNQRQVFLLVITGVMFVKMCVDTGLVNTIMGQYVFKKPFQWTGSELGYWKAVDGACGFVGNMVGIVLFKKVFKFRETTIMLIAMVSALVQLLLLGLATESYVLYIGAAAGSLSGLTMPVSMSFITQLIEKDEVGKAFVMQGLVTNISFIASNIIFTNLYSLTLAFFPGFVFITGAGVLVICVFILLWVHFASIRQNKVHIPRESEKASGVMTVVESVTKDTKKLNCKF